jgi:hypothetical protein
LLTRAASSSHRVALSYENNTTLKVEGQGQGGLAEARALCQDDNVIFGYVKLINKVDETTRTKFLLFVWQVCLMKAVLSTFFFLLQKVLLSSPNLVFCVFFPKLTGREDLCHAQGQDVGAHCRRQEGFRRFRCHGM